MIDPNLIARAVCINHPDASARLEAMNQRFTQQRIEVDLFPGVIPRLGEDPIVGAMRAHKGAIAAAKRDNLRNILIFEDDVIFLKPWSWIQRQLLDVPSDYDLVRMCIITDGVYIRRHVKGHVFRCWRAYGSQCYLVNEKCFDKILHFPETDQFDNMLCQSAFIEYAIHPLPIYHELGSSLAGNFWQQTRDDFEGTEYSRQAAVKVIDEILIRQSYQLNIQLRIIQALEVLEKSAHTQELRFLRSLTEKLQVSRQEAVNFSRAMLALSLEENKIPSNPTQEEAAHSLKI